MYVLWETGNNLNGTIPPEIGNLVWLSYIDLSNNQLSGPIPPEIGNLTRLKWLRLNDSQLSDAIPPEIGNLTALQQLTVRNNKLSGSIPSEIGNLTALESLYLDNNQLSGAIPPEIGNLTALRSLDLDSNQLSGVIPPEIGNLTALTELWLNTNQLNGSIPPEIGNLTALGPLSLNDNQLSGSIPPEIGNLAALVMLRLDNNQLSGAIPPEIGNLTALAELQLNTNQLSGSIASEISNLSALWGLSLDDNQLSGSIPSWIGNLSALTRLDLGDNQLSGTIPPEIGNLTALRTLDLFHNQLSGSIPSEIGNLSALRLLNLNDNQLSDSIPSEIGNLSTLSELRLHGNPLSGALPESMASLGNICFLTFYDTNLCVPETGPIIDWIAAWPYRNNLGTGLVCRRGPGGLSGTVTLPGEYLANDIQARVFRLITLSPSPPSWIPHYVTMTYTNDEGNYQINDLGQNINYYVQFVDPMHEYASQYYNYKTTIDQATPVTITLENIRAGIDAMLYSPQSPAVEAETETGSVAYNPDGTAQITMPRPNTSAITVTRAVTCAIGAPSAVTLTLSTGPQYAMANVSGDLYRATIPAAALTGNATLNVVAVCSEGTSTTTVGYVTLYDPSGIVSDKQTGQPIANATVTLYNVPGWLPKSGPDDDAPNTCESNLSKAPDAPWSQPAPTELGIIANADVTPTEPKLPFQYTTVAGYYGWDVSQGCWYVTIEAEGYEPLTSPVVGIPPAVTDLDLALTPLSAACTPLTSVGIVGPLSVTGTLYINTLYTFEAIITPTDATAPITYTWMPAPQTGQGTNSATYRWSAPDTYTVTLKAENCGGSVTITREFVIEAKNMFTVYLPLVLRNN